MSFTCTTHVGASRFPVTWSNGKLSGDKGLCQVAQSYARAMTGQLVGPVGGPYTVRNHLSSALSAVFILQAAFAPWDLEFTGDVPVPPPVPDGAVV